jgi:hypothetical protein
LLRADILSFHSRRMPIECTSCHRKKGKMFIKGDDS